MKKLKLSWQKLLLAVLAGAAVAVPQSGLATTRTVANLNDSGAGSLREAIAASVNGDTIDSSVSGTITLTSGELAIGRNLTILGPAAGLTVSGNHSSRVFNIGNVTVTISGLTVTNGSPIILGAYGSGIYNVGALTINNSTVSGNTAVYGGGIVNNGTLTVNNSTVSGNTTTGYGGGILNNGTLTVNNSTVSGNTASLIKCGGGIYNSGTLTVNNSTLYGNTAHCGGGIYKEQIGATGAITIHNTIIANNSTDSVGPDVFGAITSQGRNLIGKTNSSGGWVASDLTGSTNAPLNPLLGPLQDNGGPTLTMALLATSAAIDAGDNTGAPAFDQRGPGFARIVNGIIDIGAFEFVPPIPTITCPANIVTNLLSGSLVAVAWPLPAATGSPAPVVTCMPPSGSGFGVGVNTVLCTASNVAGMATCSFTISVCASNLTVQNTMGSGPGSLRQATLDLCAGGRITFAAGLNGSLIVLTNGELIIDKNLTMSGPGPKVLTLSGSNSNRIFHIQAGGALRLFGLTLTGGRIQGTNGVAFGLDPALAAGQSVCGGAILNEGNLYLEDCVVLNSTAVGGAGGHGANGGFDTLDGVAGGSGGSADGGAICNLGILEMQRCTFGGNLASAGNGGAGGRSTSGGSGAAGGAGGNANGAAVSGSGQFTATNSTFSSNTAQAGLGGAAGSGLGAPSGGPGGTALGGALRLAATNFALISCTISSNTVISGTGGAGGTGGGGGAPGLAKGGGLSGFPTGTVKNTIVARNTATGTWMDLDGSLSSLGFNLIGVRPTNTTWSSSDLLGTSTTPLDPKLSSLQDNGGFTPTMALLPGSPAIDSGSSFGLTTDQRAAPRPFDLSSVTNASGGDGSDIGAFELGSPRLDIQRLANNVVLSWPTYYGGFTLESVTNLSASNNWGTVPGTPAVVGDQFSVTNSAAGNKFYRLFKP